MLRFLADPLELSIQFEPDAGARGMVGIGSGWHSCCWHNFVSLITWSVSKICSLFVMVIKLFWASSWIWNVFALFIYLFIHLFIYLFLISMSEILYPFVPSAPPGCAQTPIFSYPVHSTEGHQSNLHKNSSYSKSSSFVSSGPLKKEKYKKYKSVTHDNTSGGYGSMSVSLLNPAKSRQDK